MSVWQIIIAAGILISIGIACWRDGAIPWRLAIAMPLGFLVAMSLSPESPVAIVEHYDARAVAVLDLLCAAILFTGNKRDMIVAALFLAMVPFTVIRFHFELRGDMVYVILDVLAYLQFLVIGWPRGKRIGNGSDHRMRGASGDDAMASRGRAGNDPAILARRN